MRFLIHPQVRLQAPAGLAWAKAFVGRFDTSQVGWLRIDFGREYRDRLGRRYRKYRGIYGRCWYPTRTMPSIRLSCQVPGPFPCTIVTRQRPRYRNPDGSWPGGIKPRRQAILQDPASGKAWVRTYGQTIAQDLDEGIVWIVAHEAFHWLRKTRQIPGRNNEIEADAFADRTLGEFRRSREPQTVPPAGPWQSLLWEEAGPTPPTLPVPARPTGDAQT